MTAQWLDAWVQRVNLCAALLCAFAGGYDAALGDASGVTLNTILGGISVAILLRPRP